MIFESKIFYKSFLKEYHKIKAIYLKKMLENLSKYESEFFNGKLNNDEKDQFEKTLKADLRQTYFHSIETFFEIFFALNPKGKKYFDDEKILFNLTNSKWGKNYNRIKEIAENPKILDFLNEKITFHNYNISIGHYLFYMGIFSKNNFPQEIFDNIDKSIEAIKYGIEILAKDFTKKDEYNAYKHGIRILPTVANLTISNAETMEKIAEWDISESMSFYLKSKDPNELVVITKLFDSKRDYLMTHLSSNLIENMIKYRKIVFCNNENQKKENSIEIYFFAKEYIKNFQKINVNIQDIKYTVKNE